MHIIEEKWQDIIDYLVKEFDVKPLSYTTWIKPLQVAGIEKDVVYIEGESDIWVKYMEPRYTVPLQFSIKEVTDLDCSVAFKVKGTYRIEKEKRVKPVMDAKTRFSFENFIVDENNRMAHMAACAVAEEPGYNYASNPLFIYGGAGLGKTHLLQAIEKHIGKEHPELKVCYTTTENFTNELIEALKQGGGHVESMKMTEFREKYRQLDVLLVDDIQFIIRKRSTQEEFFHTFNDLYMQGKQIVISSDKPPKLLEDLESRYVSRFENGLVVNVGMPSYSTRKAILEKKIADENWYDYGITDEAIDYLAQNVTSNIRELEGALNKLVMYLRLNQIQMPMELDLVRELLQDVVFAEEKKVVTPEFVLEIVAQHFGVSVVDLQGKKKDNKIALPRQVAMYLIRKATDCKLEGIGYLLGKRHYATVKHGIEKICENMESDHKLKSSVLLLEKMIGIEEC